MFIHGNVFNITFCNSTVIEQDIEAINSFSIQGMMAKVIS
jgi:hypothetical protein